MRTSTVGTWNSRRGVTLFELLAVLAILACVVGMVIPLLPLDVRGSALDETVHRMRQALDQGRTRARLARAPVAVRFLSDGAQVLGGNRFECAGSVRVVRVLALDGQVLEDREIVADALGVYPAAIVVVRDGERVYSLLVRPVLRRVDVVDGVAGPKEFTG